MSEAELAALLTRYAARDDEFAQLVRALIADIQHARVDADIWQNNYNAMRDRLDKVAAIAGRLA